MVYIIAEAGVNHNGSFEMAKRLIEVAKEAGVDAVKFQTWKTELLVTPDSQLAQYQKVNNTETTSQFEMLKKLELSYQQFRELKAYAEEVGIEFLSTPDEKESADFLNEIVAVFKIGSGELTNLPFLKHIATFGKPVILSTGMGSMEEVKVAVNAISSVLDRDKITLLHATTQYPTPLEEVNLRAMITLRDYFGLKVGYSDHTLGIEVSVAAVAMGAEVIEKHFTLDKSLPGPDHKASLDPLELADMVVALRNVEKALGNGVKQATSSERENINIVRKSIVALMDIRKGEEFNASNLTIKRPGSGISPDNWDKVIGQIAERDFQKDELIVL